MLIPDWKAIEAFPAPLEPGERGVVEAYSSLAESLAEDGIVCRVYVQPYLENLRPDTVVEVEGQGFTVIETKDTPDPTPRRLEGAQRQARRYQEKLVELSLPEVEQVLADHGWEEHAPVVLGHLRGLVTPCIAFPFADQVSHSGAATLITAHSLSQQVSLPRPTPGAPPRAPKDVVEVSRAAFFEGLRRWLVPPFHRADQGDFLTTGLTASQRPHALPRGRGNYRLEGPVGSGKTLVLAHKAAALASAGKRVLFLCYNVPLVTYLHDLVNRMCFDFSWENIHVCNFHDLVKDIRIALDLDLSDEARQDRQQFLDHKYPAIALRGLDENPGNQFVYDAILVDEGQDFLDEWLELIARCLVPGGEFLIARDLAQNIYGRPEEGLLTTKGIPGLRFSAPWARLESTFRMSPVLTSAISDFAQYTSAGHRRFVPDETRSSHDDLFPGARFCKWQNISPDERQGAILGAIKSITEGTKLTHPSDIAVVAYENEAVREIVQALSRGGLRSVHLYDEKGDRSRSRAAHFYKGDGRIKVITGHSFKGFEVWGVILCIDDRGGLTRKARWTYTAMGRAIGGLWVLNEDPRYCEIAEWWPDIDPQ